jgi:hypothetical protein
MSTFLDAEKVPELKFFSEPTREDNINAFIRRYQ